MCYCIQTSAQIAGGGGLNPLAYWCDPLALLNFNLLGGSPQPPSSLAMNGLLPIITCPPSAIHYASHVYMFLTACSYKKILVLNNFQKISIFEIKNLNFWRRGGLPPPTVGARRDPSPGHIGLQRACLNLTAYGARPRSCFL